MIDGLVNPPRTEWCYGPACPDTTTTTLAPTTTTPRPLVRTTSTTTGAGDTSLSGLYECLNVVGGALPGECLQGSYDGRCEASCPCCRVRSSVVAPILVPYRPSGTPTDTDYAGDSGSSVEAMSWIWNLMLVGFACVAVLMAFFIGFAIFRANTKVGSKAVVETKPPEFKRRSSSRKSSREERKVREAWTDEGADEVWTEFDEDPGQYPQEIFQDDPGPTVIGRRHSVGSPSPARRSDSEPARRSAAGGRAKDTRRSATQAEGSTSANGSRAPRMSQSSSTKSTGEAAAEPGEQRPKPEAKPGGQQPRPGSDARATGGASKSSADVGGSAGAGTASPGAASGGSGTARSGGAAAAGSGPAGSRANNAGGQGSGNAESGPSKDAPPPSAATPPQVGSELVDKVAKELDFMQDKDLEVRKQHFKQLLLQWHPDKNRSESAEEAAAVFRYLMGRRARYLDA